MNASTLSRSTINFVEITDRADRVVILASGPSLKNFNFSSLKGLGYIICVNDAWRAARKFAHAWVTIDTRNLQRRLPAFDFSGPRYVAAPDDYGNTRAAYGCDRVTLKGRRIRFIRRSENGKLSEDPKYIHGGNSAFGALNIAYHMRAKKILLLGVDANNLRTYFYGNRREPAERDDRMKKHMQDLFSAAAPQLKKRGIKVINGSKNSSILYFPRMAPEDAVTAFNSK